METRQVSWACERDAGWARLVAMEMESGGGLGETGKTGGDSLGERVWEKVGRRLLAGYGHQCLRRGHMQPGLGFGE